MRYEAITKYVLSEFEIGKRYIGYNYIVYGIYLIERDKSCIGHITKSLYIDIANKYDTTAMCVERGIRATIEMIWRNKEYNTELLVKIFGSTYENHRPTNTRFFELLYTYVESFDGDGCEGHCLIAGCKYCRLRECVQT